MLVMKFGGTSVADATAIARVINLIKTRRDKKTIVVVSAISEATNILTQVAHLAAQNEVKQYQTILAQLKNRHLEIAANLLDDKNLLVKTQNQIHAYLAELDTALEGVTLIAELSDRSFAKIVAYGELLSSAILHAAMLKHDLKNTLVDARNIIITNDIYQKGTPNLEYMAQIVPPLLNKTLDQNQIVLTQGFIASTKDGVTTILGREGSDYSASLIGMVMDADEIQIWTDVDGVMTCDPRKIANTKFIPQLSFKEAAELSYFGAKVIHPLTIQPAAKKNIPVRILNSLNSDPKQSGTIITKNTPSKQTQINAITYRENIKVINVAGDQSSIPTNFLHHIFSVFDAHHTAIDAATISGANLSLVPNQHENLSKIIDELFPFTLISIEEDKSLVCLIGNNLHNIGVLTKNICQILDGFSIRMMVHGSSHTNLILIVETPDVMVITQKLHDTFFNN